MRGDVLTFKFSFPIGLWCWGDSFVLRNPARTPSVGTLVAMAGRPTSHRQTITTKTDFRFNIFDKWLF